MHITLFVFYVIALIFASLLSWAGTTRVLCFVLQISTAEGAKRRKDQRDTGKFVAVVYLILFVFAVYMYWR